MASESVPGSSGWGLRDQGSRGGQEISPSGDIHSRVLGSQPSASTSLSVLLASPAPPALTDLPPSSLAGTDALGHDAPPAAVCSGAACVTGPSLLHLLHVSARHGPTLLPPEEDTWAPPGWGEVGERGRQSQGHSGQAPGVFSWQQVCPLWPPSVLELATTKSILSRSSRLQEGT